MGTTADKIAKAILTLERSGGIDLSAYRAVKTDFGEARLGDDRLRELWKTYDPAHASMLYAQNFASFLSEEMSRMRELRQYADSVIEAEDEYYPGYPPKSPVTTSYFTTWALFDLLFGQSHETIGTCILRLAQDVPLAVWLVDAIVGMQKSRMGFYVHEGFENRYVRLREIDSEGTRLVHVASRFRGEKGQIWFGRLVSPMNDLFKYEVFFTTPYIVMQTTEATIAAYLGREIKRLGSRRVPRKMEGRDFILKHGPSPNHWSEYIFCGYSNHVSNAIFIEGIPDDRESLPHGKLLRTARP